MLVMGDDDTTTEATDAFAKARRVLREKREWEKEEYGPFDEIPGRCNARKPDGTGLCRQVAGWQTNHSGYGRCKRHGGASPNGIAAAHREMAKDAVVTYGLPVDIDPHTALLDEVKRTAGHVQYLLSKVMEHSERDLVWGKSKEEEYAGGEGGGFKIVEEAKPSIWLTLYHKERRHLVEVCKTAISCGIAERQVEVYEQFAHEILGTLRRVLTALGIDPGDGYVREVVRGELMAISTGGGAGKLGEVGAKVEVDGEDDEDEDE